MILLNHKRKVIVNMTFNVNIDLIESFYDIRYMNRKLTKSSLRNYNFRYVNWSYNKNSNICHLFERLVLTLYNKLIDIFNRVHINDKSNINHAYLTLDKLLKFFALGKCDLFWWKLSRKKRGKCKIMYCLLVPMFIVAIIRCILFL